MVRSAAFLREAVKLDLREDVSRPPRSPLQFEWELWYSVKPRIGPFRLREKGNNLAPGDPELYAMQSGEEECLKVAAS